MRSSRRMTPILLCLSAVIIAASLAAPLARAAGVQESATPPANGEEWTPECSPECEIVIGGEETEESEFHYHGGAPGGGLTPQELEEAYDLPRHGGSSSTIAVVDGPSDPTAAADLNSY